LQHGDFGDAVAGRIASGGFDVDDRQPRLHGYTVW
jgi:hypothetical protein